MGFGFQRDLPQNLIGVLDMLTSCYCNALHHHTQRVDAIGWRPTHSANTAQFTKIGMFYELYASAQPSSLEQTASARVLAYLA